MQLFYITQIGARPGSSMIVTNQLGEFEYHIVGQTGFLGAKFRLIDRQGQEYVSIVQTSLGIFPRFEIHEANNHFGSFGLSLYTDAIIYITGANWLTWTNTRSSVIQIRNLQHQLALAYPDQNYRSAVNITDDHHTQALILTVAFLIRWRNDHNTKIASIRSALNAGRYATKLNMYK